MVPYGADGSGLRDEGGEIVKGKRIMNDTSKADEAKAARLAAALRENLKRRKAQSREAAAAPAGPDAPSE